eukprot:191800-Hanusia_phi.AAC.2
MDLSWCEPNSERKLSPPSRFRVQRPPGPGVPAAAERQCHASSDRIRRAPGTTTATIQSKVKLPDSFTMPPHTPAAACDFRLCPRSLR